MNKKGNKCRPRPTHPTYNQMRFDTDNLIHDVVHTESKPQPRVSYVGVVRTPMGTFMTSKMSKKHAVLCRMKMLQRIYKNEPEIGSPKEVIFDKRYHRVGEPCDDCGSDIWYAKWNLCVACHRQNQKKKRMLEF